MSSHLTGELIAAQDQEGASVKDQGVSFYRIQKVSGKSDVST
jgi:hypothetical protein